MVFQALRGCRGLLARLIAFLSIGMFLLFGVDLCIKSQQIVENGNLSYTVVDETLEDGSTELPSELLGSLSSDYVEVPYGYPDGYILDTEGTGYLVVPAVFSLVAVYVLGFVLAAVVVYLFLILKPVGTIRWYLLLIVWGICVAWVFDSVCSVYSEVGYAGDIVLGFTASSILVRTTILIISRKKRKVKRSETQVEE